MAHLFQLLKLPRVLSSTQGESARSCHVQLHRKSPAVEELGFGVLTPHLLKVKISVCVIRELCG